MVKINYKSALKRFKLGKPVFMEMSGKYILAASINTMKLHRSNGGSFAKEANDKKLLIRMPAQLYNRLTIAAENRGKTKSELIREIIKGAV